MKPLEGRADDVLSAVVTISIADSSQGPFNRINHRRSSGHMDVCYNMRL